ncbi:MAG: hypothetical protein JWO53_1272, partial [Chlamydiia bacterium]|nr:hypothetical protein [Chlamydiia bacterium]
KNEAMKREEFFRTADRLMKQGSLFE